jgi:hypothetical protein
MKRWYGVTVVVGLEDLDAETSEIMLEEQVHLVEADNPEHALSIGKQIGEEHCKLDDDPEWNGRKARRFFGGVRRVVATQNLYGDAIGKPINRCEITYSEFLLKSRADLVKFMEGEEVSIQCVDD